MKLKRILSGAIACAMAATVASSMAATATAAGTGVAIGVGSTTAEAGGTFSVDVSVTNIPSTGISALEFAIGYDASVVTITGITAGAIADTGAAAAELGLNSSLGSTMVSGTTYSCFDYAILTNQVSAIWATGLADSSYWLKTTGVLFTITGKIADGATGSTDLTVEAIKRETYSGSGQTNSSMYAAAIDSDLAVSNYTVTGSKGTVTIGGGTSTTKYGDVKIDGAININDLIKLSKALGKLETLTAQEALNADVLFSGNVDINDLIKLAKFLGKMIPESSLGTAN